MAIEDTSEPRAHRIVVRVMVPPGASSVMPLLPEIEKLVKDQGLDLLGIQATLEDEDAPSNPSIFGGAARE